MLKRMLGIALAALILLSFCTANAEYTGESIPTVCCRADEFEYSGIDSSIELLEANGNPANIDILPTQIPISELIELKSKISADIFCNTVLFGVDVSTASRKIILSGNKVDDLALLESALECFPCLERVELCDCGLGNDEMEELCALFSDIRFVWKVKFGSWSLRTDATAALRLALPYAPVSHFLSQHRRVLPLRQS